MDEIQVVTTSLKYIIGSTVGAIFAGIGYVWKKVADHENRLSVIERQDVTTKELLTSMNAQIGKVADEIQHQGERTYTQNEAALKKQAEIADRLGYLEAKVGK